MYEALRDAIESAPLPSRREELVELLALHDQLRARLTDAVRGFDEAQLWDLDGASSMTAWLRAEGGAAHGRARHLVRVAERMARLPHAASAWREGRLTGDQVDLLERMVPARLVHRLHDDEAWFVPVLEPLDAAQTADAVRAWVRKVEALDDGAEDAEPPRRLRLRRLLDGVRVLDGQFDADSGHVIDEALRLARREDDPEEQRTRGQADADALIDALRFFVGHQACEAHPGRRRPTTHLVMDLADHHVNVLAALGIATDEHLDDLLDEQPASGVAERTWLREALRRAASDPDAGSGRTLDGHQISAALAAQLGCDSQLRRLLTLGSEVLDHGRPLPAIPQRLRTAVLLRDQGCRFPGCDRPVAWVEVHHVRFRADGGPDAIHNLVALCGHHHRVLHRPGWAATLSLDGTLVVVDPQGRRRVTYAPGPGGRPPPLTTAA